MLRADVIKSFNEKIRITPGCWLWLGGKAKDGYGLMKIKQKSIPAHRVSYVLHKGKIPKGMFVLHSCDNPSCVNPDHLSVGTHKQNMLEARLRGRIKSKLTAEEVSQIRDLLSCEIFSQTVIAKFYEVTQANVRAIANGKTWKHVP